MNRIQERRKELNIRQVDLAKTIGTTQPTLSGWEQGRYEPDMRALSLIADALDTSVDYLVGKVDDPDFIVTVTDEDPQILDIRKACKGMNAQGIQRVVEYAEYLAATGRYPKKSLSLKR